MAKLKTRLCARCKRQQRTGNAYCKECDAIRKAEERGRVPMPETVEERDVRETVDATFNLLDKVPGAEVEVKGVKMRSNGDGTVDVTYRNNRANRRSMQWVKAHSKGA